MGTPHSIFSMVYFPLLRGLPLKHLYIIISKASSIWPKNSTNPISFPLKVTEILTSRHFLFIAILQICKDPEFLKISHDIILKIIENLLEFYLTPLRKFLLVSLGFLGNEGIFIDVTQIRITIRGDR